jgi:hypothetical protein
LQNNAGMAKLQAATVLLSDKKQLPVSWRAGMNSFARRKPIETPMLIENAVKEVTLEEAGRIAGELCHKAGVLQVEIKVETGKKIIDNAKFEFYDDAPNCLVLGASLLKRGETVVRGIVGHELGHYKRHDALRKVTLVALPIAAELLALAIVQNITSLLYALASIPIVLIAINRLRRQHELRSDEISVRLNGSGAGMKEWLQTKLDERKQKMAAMPPVPRFFAKAWNEVDSFFMSAHPSHEKRIRNIEKMEEELARNAS